MGQQRETYIFRYTGEPNQAKKEFAKLKQAGDINILESTPNMVLGEASPNLITKIKRILTNWLVIPNMTYDYPDNQVQLKKVVKSRAK